MPGHTTEVPEAAIEAAAKARFEGRRTLDRTPFWDDLLDGHRQAEMRCARRDLEAAAPFLTAPLREERDLEKARGDMLLTETELLRLRADSVEHRLEEIGSESAIQAAAYAVRKCNRNGQALTIYGAAKVAVLAALAATLQDSQVEEKEKESAQDQPVEGAPGIKGRTLPEEEAVAKRLGWTLDCLRKLQKDSSVHRAFRELGEEQREEPRCEKCGGEGLVDISNQGSIETHPCPNGCPQADDDEPDCSTQEAVKDEERKVVYRVLVGNVVNPRAIHFGPEVGDVEAIANEWRATGATVERYVPEAQRDSRLTKEEVLKKLTALAEDYERRLREGKWAGWNSHDQIEGWGQGVRAAIQLLDATFGDDQSEEGK